MSNKLKVALVIVAVAVSACAQQEPEVLTVAPEPTTSKY
jgi:hypothetical protein